MEQALELVRQGRRFLVSGHLRADGDCLGAESVLYHALRALGKEVSVVNPDPPDPRYAFLAEHTPFTVYQDGAALPDYDAVLVCDCSSLARLGEMGRELAAGRGRRVAVDHHLLSPADAASWHALVHDVSAPASGLLALRFARRLGAELEMPALEAAFTSLAADTGWFKYSNADAAAWSAAAELVAAGVTPAKIYDAIYQSWDAGYPRGVGVALRNLEYLGAGRLALAWLSRRDLAAAGATLDDSDWLLDLLRAVASVEAVGFVYERPDGRVKASLRSKRWLNVHRAAQEMGGGGHARAAGVTFAPEVVLEQGVAAVRRALLAACERDPSARADQSD